VKQGDKHMGLVYTSIKKRIGNIEENLRQIFEAKQNQAASKSLFGWQVFRLNLALFFLGLLENFFKFLIILFSSPAKSFTLFFNPNAREACTFSYHRFKTIHYKVKVFSLFGASMMALAIVIVSLLVNLIFGNRPAGRAQVAIDGLAGSGARTQDQTPPLRSARAFERQASDRGISVRLSFKTDEASDCRYAAVAGADYFSMEGKFSVSENNLSHFIDLADIEDGQHFTYYTRCVDGAGNANNDDFPLSLVVSVQDGIPIFLLQNMDLPAVSGD
jgi:hypothetical protein